MALVLHLGRNTDQIAFRSSRLALGNMKQSSVTGRFRFLALSLESESRVGPKGPYF